MAWRDYEREVAGFFASLGCTVEVQATVQGIRTKHNIDVWALSNRFGLFTRWVIECKAWSSSVPKEKVLALRSIVEDIGADRGFILSESGFQSGAREAANSSNITVASVSELREWASNDLVAVELDALHRRLTQLHLRMGELSVVTHQGKSSRVSRTRKGMTDPNNLIQRLGMLAVTEMGVERARVGRLPVPMVSPDDPDQYARANTAAEVCHHALSFIAWLDEWVRRQEAAITEADG